MTPRSEYLLIKKHGETVTGECFKKLFETTVIYPVPPIVVGQPWFTDPSLGHAYLGITETQTNNIVTSAPLAVFYIRPAIPILWNFLNSCNSISVIGSPGDGKSIACLQYGFRQDSNTNRFLFIRGVKAVVVVIYFRLATSTYEVAHVPHSSNVANFVEALLDNARSQNPVLQVNSLILDGFSSKLHEDVHSIMMMFPLVKFIRAVSWQSQTSPANVSTVRPMNDHIFVGWSKDDYWNAHLHGCFAHFPVPLTRELLDERVFYAGCNARFFSTGGTHWAQRIVALVHKAMDNVTDLETMSLQSVGQSSVAAVNILFSKSDIDNSKDAPSSQLVARMIAQRTGHAFINSARTYLPDNPSFQGWITELEVLTLMRTSLLLPLYSFQNAAGSLQVVLTAATAAYRLAMNGVENQIECSFRRLAAAKAAANSTTTPIPMNNEVWSSMGTIVWFFDSVDLGSKRLAGNHYYFPVKWNHEYFDGIFLHTRRTAYFFNVTISEQHSFNPMHLIPYINVLSTHRVEMIFICPKHIAAIFKKPLFKTYGVIDNWGNSKAALRRRMFYQILYEALLQFTPVGQIPYFNIRVVSYQP